MIPASNKDAGQRRIARRTAMLLFGVAGLFYLGFMLLTMWSQ